MRAVGAARLSFVLTALAVVWVSRAYAYDPQEFQKSAQSLVDKQVLAPNGSPLASVGPQGQWVPYSGFLSKADVLVLLDALLRGGKLRGPQGATGAQGDKGDTGPQGDRGREGRVGPTPDKPPPGEQGPQGDKGDPGKPGVGWTPAEVAQYEELKATVARQEKEIAELTKLVAQLTAQLKAKMPAP